MPADVVEGYWPWSKPDPATPVTPATAAHPRITVDYFIDAETGRWRSANVPPGTSTPEIWWGPELAQHVPARPIRQGIVDSGVRSDHPIIHPTLHDGDQRDFTGEGVTDLCGHGTMVAMVAVQSWRPWPVELVSAKALRSDKTGSRVNLVAAIDWAVTRNLTTLNISAGAPADGCTGGCDLCSAVRRVVDAGVHLTIAAGNTIGVIPCPATVGAILGPDAGVMVAYPHPKGTPTTYDPRGGVRFLEHTGPRDALELIPAMLAAGDDAGVERMLRRGLADPDPIGRADTAKQLVLTKLYRDNDPEAAAAVIREVTTLPGSRPAMVAALSALLTAWTPPDGH